MSDLYGITLQSSEIKNLNDNRVIELSLHFYKSKLLQSYHYFMTPDDLLNHKTVVENREKSNAT